MPETKIRSNLLEELESLTAPERYQAARLLEAAAEFPDLQWTQNAKARTRQGHSVPYDLGYEYEGVPFQFCAVGHIERAARAEPQASAWARRMMTAVTRETRQNVPHWNDEPERTPEEIRQAFRQAARRLYKEAAIIALAPEGIAAIPIEPDDPIAEAFMKIGVRPEKEERMRQAAAAAKAAPAAPAAPANS